MRQKYRTTCFADALVDYPGSLEDDPNWKEEVVGFRLVHDDEDRVNRGGSWLNTAAYARAANHIGDYLGARFDSLGFRLAFDREDT